MNIFQKIKSGMLISGAVLIVAGLDRSSATSAMSREVEDTAADWCLESF